MLNHPLDHCALKYATNIFTQINLDCRKVIPKFVLIFQPPQEAEKWNGVRIANQYGNECSQFQLLFGSKVGDEDCLFLNVYTPKVSIF